MSLLLSQQRFRNAFFSLIALVVVAAGLQLWAIGQLDANAQHINQMGQQRALVMQMRVGLAQIRQASAAQLPAAQAVLAQQRQVFDATLMATVQGDAAINSAAARTTLDTALAYWQQLDPMLQAVVQAHGPMDATALERALAFADTHGDTLFGLMDQLTQRVQAHHHTQTQRMALLNGAMLLLTALLLVWIWHSKQAMTNNMEAQTRQMRHEVSDARAWVQAAETQLEVQAQVSPDLVWIKDIEGRYRYCNHPYEVFYGCLQSAIVGQSDFELTDADSARQFQASDRQALAQPEPVRLQEWRSATGQNTQRLFEIIKTPVIDVHGKVTGVQGVARDITLQHQTQQAFNTVKERLTLLDLCMAKTKDVIIITEAEPLNRPGPRIVYVNDAFERLTGYSREEAIGQTPRMLQGIKTQRSELNRLRSAFAVWASVRVEVINYTKSGQEYWVELEVTPVANEAGWFTHWVSVQRDITERKQAETQRLALLEKSVEASRLKAEFIANISHEFRTPMNGILGLAQVLLNAPLTTKQHDYVQALYDSATGLMTILNAMLDFRKIEAGTLSLEKLPFSVNQLMHDCQQAVQPKAQAKGLAFELTVDNTFPAVVLGDVTRIRQVLDYLLDNAVKFTNAGSITLVAGSMNYADDRPYLHFEVTDTGIGISDTQCALLFRPFVQVDGGITRRQGGTGLGLVLGSRLVELMHGHIGIISAPGRGSTVWFAVPLLPPEDLQNF